MMMMMMMIRGRERLIFPARLNFGREQFFFSFYFWYICLLISFYCVHVMVLNWLLMKLCGFLFIWFDESERRNDVVKLAKKGCAEINAQMRLFLPSNKINQY